MKRLSLLFSILLIAWICIAAYWYTCKVRNNCGDAAEAAVPEMTETPSEEVPSAETPVAAEVDSVAIAREYLAGVGTKTYYFEFASTQLNTAGDDEQYFTSLDYLLSNSSGTAVRIVGHACSRGSAAANERFSKLRAERVKKHLIEKGISEGQLILEWKGDREPAASNDTEEGRKLNRRVDISINQ